ncbi:DNA polymerase Y family protein [Terasakiella sp. A23]|uniref:Y-family DNA polymerase n=1 Tax=Terasakiella sp. FCG-A23 TaxID=3080561 RepID=UPI002954F66B|nr:DNA polymerase Y family protein [Terasakiella sp. A23]MDV7341257.1 DNA polymerase Y family protein [Terasakiella sp. A23]
MKQRFLYLWYPHLASDRYMQVKGMDQDDQLPFATVTSDHRGVLLAGLNKAAIKEHLQTQMRLTDARAIYPPLQTLPIAPDQDQAFLLEMAKTADLFSPWIAIDGPHVEIGEGGLWLEITGAAHLFGGEEAMMEQVLESYRPFNATLRLGLADSAPAAWAAARFHGGKGRLREHQTWQETQSFPLQALNLETEVIQRLNRLGLRTLADLRDIPRANLTVRFGHEIIERLDQLVGTIPLHLPYLQSARLFEEKAFFPDPLGAAENVEQAVNHLLIRLCLRLKKEHLGLRRLGLQFRRVDGRLSFFQIATSAPTHEVKHLMRLIEHDLPGVDPGFGIEHLHIRAMQTQWQEKKQASLNDKPSERYDPVALNGLIDRLRHRLGTQSVSYPAHQESHLPERAVFTSLTPQAHNDEPPVLPKRPIRLVSPPEPLKVTKKDANGMPQHCQWRRMDMEIRQLSGPERITREWWRKLSHDLWDAQLGMRDYFRAEDKAGRNLWLCRVKSQAHDFRWFVHGWFG